MRPALPFLFVLLACWTPAWGQEAVPSSALTYARSINIPLNGVQLYDKVLEAWTWTFGREPGARLSSTDRNSGLLDGSARFNFRSALLVGREETMGVVQYRVVIRAHPGECRVLVSELTHTGNRNTPRGGIHLGLLTRSTTEAGVPGMGRANAARLRAEMNSAAEERLTTLLRTFEARLRASVEP